MISDQYAAVMIATTDGRVITGRIVNLNGDNLMVNTDMLDPNAMTNVNRKQIEEIEALEGVDDAGGPARTRSRRTRSST